MKKVYLFSTLLILLLLTLHTNALAAGYKRIDGTELQKMMKDPVKEIIVDVREPWRYNKAHIPGAINIPFDNAHERVVKELPRDERIVFVCHGGPMGDELSEILLDNGFTDVYNLKGGMRRWKGELTR